MVRLCRPTYGITRTLKDIDFDPAIDRVTAAPAQNGFGVLTSIDAQTTLKQKVGEDIPR